jgi:hypothetical protein
MNHYRREISDEKDDPPGDAELALKKGFDSAVGSELALWLFLIYDIATKF